MKILVASNDQSFNVSMCRAYKSLGHSVTCGSSEFWMCLNDFDLLHLHWPEELLGWNFADAKLMDRVLANLDKWRQTAKLICTVHNDLPHGHQTPAMASFYQKFYDRMDLIGHFTEVSSAIVMARFPEIEAARHIVHGMNDYDHVRPLAMDRSEAREMLGLPMDSCVIGVIGQLRTKAELDLLTAGLAAADRRILFAARRPPPRNMFERSFGPRSFARWRRRNDVMQLEGYIEDREVVAIMQGCDAIVIPRCHGELNSGILPFAMTFGTPLIVPDFGTFSGLLGNSLNKFYKSGDPVSMSAAIAAVQRSDCEAIRRDNLRIVSEWGWDKALPRLLQAL